MEYYSGQCRQCGEDCDGDFCCWQCEEEWQLGKADFHEPDFPLVEGESAA